LAADQATSETTVGEPQTFRSVTALIVWWVWVLFAVGNLIDLAVQGRDHLSLVAAAILVMITGIAYVTGLRPRIIVAADDVTIKNPVRDHRIPWRNVEKADLADLLRVHCRVPGTESTKVISAWAVHYSRRKQFTTEAKARRSAGRGSRSERFGMGGGGSITAFGIPQAASQTTSDTEPPSTSAEAEAERVKKVLNDRADAVRANDAGINGASPDATGADEAWASETGPAGSLVAAGTGTEKGTVPVISTWSRDAIAALVIPALILLICSLI
jgi:Bacterial PH domain